MASIKDTLKNAGVKITKRTQRVGQLLSDFGIDVSKGNIKKYTKRFARKENLDTLFSAFDIPQQERAALRKQFNESGLNKKGIYEALAQKTGQKPGDSFQGLNKAVEFSNKNNVTAKGLFGFLKKKTGKFSNQKFLEYGANRPDVFKKATKLYNLKTGAPSVAQLTQKEAEAQQAAEEYQAPDVALSDAYLAEQNRRNLENYNVSLENTNYQYGNNVADLALNQELAQDNLIGGLNAAGQYNSSIYGKKMGQLAEQQGRETGSLNQNYQSLLKQYQRQKSQGVFDLGQLEQQRALDFGRSKQDYATDYVTDYTQGVADNSQNYYNRQNAVANDASQYLTDLANVG